MLESKRSSLIASTLLAVTACGSPEQTPQEPNNFTLGTVEATIDLPDPSVDPSVTVHENYNLPKELSGPGWIQGSSMAHYEVFLSGNLYRGDRLIYGGEGEVTTQNNEGFINILDQKEGIMFRLDNPARLLTTVGGSVELEANRANGDPVTYSMQGRILLRSRFATMTEER